jgi:hypothetical protein
VRGGLDTIRFDLLGSLPDVLCAVSTRSGGVSDGAFHSLNLGFSTGDVPERVRENRLRLFSHLDLPPGSVVAARQVHGSRVIEVGATERGRGSLDPRTALPDADGLLTRERGVFVLGLSADCPLLTLVAPPDRGIVLAHSGWRGTAGGMPAAAVDCLARATGADPGEMLAVIGPGIGPCCYEVGEEVLDSLPPGARAAARGPAALPGGESPGDRGSPAGRHRLDLSLAIRVLLEEAGVPRERIEACPRCSSCEAERFFSHRRDRGVTGRVAMLAGLR